MSLYQSVVYYFVANFLLFRKHRRCFSKINLYEVLLGLQASIVDNILYIGS